MSVLFLLGFIFVTFVLIDVFSYIDMKALERIPRYFEGTGYKVGTIAFLFSLTLAALCVNIAATAEKIGGDNRVNIIAAITVMGAIQLWIILEIVRPKI